MELDTRTTVACFITWLLEQAVTEQTACIKAMFKH